MKFSKPSRVKFGGPKDTWGRDLGDLKEAVTAHCEDVYLQYFQEKPQAAFLASLRVDPERQRAAFSKAQAQLLKAKKPFEAIAALAEQVRNLAKQDLVSAEADDVAKEIGNLAANYLSSFEFEPTRGDWLANRVDRFCGSEVPLDVCTALALLSGWWPEAINAAHVNETGSSPADVFGREKKALRKARLDTQNRRQALVSDPLFQKLVAALIPRPPDQSAG